MPIALPDPHQVPRGPHRQFLVEVHRLYRAAGLPSVREMSREIRERDDLPDTVSHETISNLLRGEAVQRWAKVESVVLILARRAREPEDRVLATVKPLWLATQTVVQAGDSAVQRSLDADTSALLASVQTRVEQGGQIGLVVEHETARLSYVMGVYRCTLRRALFNGWDRPITQFPIRIQVDRFPDDPARSLAHHRDHPLTFEELRLVASCAGEPMDWRPTSDRETYKAVSLLFENVQSRFPLYPGQRTTIAYSYTVSEILWGPWFQRTVRHPTRFLGLEVEFPAALRPMVWGIEVNAMTGASPLPTPITMDLADDRAVFGWQTDNPEIHTSYRMEWRFRGQTLNGE